ncbi:hypothetical protein OHV35_05200 [Acinetobacter baumannii]|uniref:hypothetical protein n=1 Tax=Acinetobacter baumannii TaxID=470 RepID=UPI0023427CFC|nr:hypothetical protein [Acinetobacter baumannii]MDC4442814.1 hypothetical protein [Acinetobacter baumannii]MDH2495256.1 hypothetical protein [Acinetobacter baumannii]MDO7332593.1 hypothetical protein [Acinetobacter baumannii]
MSYYVRRVKRTVWPEEVSDLEAALNDFDNIIADPLTDCTRTSDGTLSLWEINTKEDRNKAIISLITAPEQKTISSMEIIYITPENLSDYSLSLNKTDGRTTVTEFVSTHYDIVGINYKKLKDVGKLILSILISDGSERIGKSDVLRILKEYLLLDIKKNYLKINNALLIFMGEEIQDRLLETDFYKEIEPTLFLDIKISVINKLFENQFDLINSKIDGMNERENMAFKGSMKMQKIRSKITFNQNFLDFINS